MGSSTVSAKQGIAGRAFVDIKGPGKPEPEVFGELFVKTEFSVDGGIIMIGDPCCRIDLGSQDNGGIEFSICNSTHHKKSRLMMEIELAANLGSEFIHDI